MVEDCLIRFTPRLTLVIIGPEHHHRVQNVARKPTSKKGKCHCRHLQRDTTRSAMSLPLTVNGRYSRQVVRTTCFDASHCWCWRTRRFVDAARDFVVMKCGNGARHRRDRGASCTGQIEFEHNCHKSETWRCGQRQAERCGSLFRSPRPKYWIKWVKPSLVSSLNYQ